MNIPPKSSSDLEKISSTGDNGASDTPQCQTQLNTISVTLPTPLLTSASSRQLSPNCLLEPPELHGFPKQNSTRAQVPFTKYEFRSTSKTSPMSTLFDELVCQAFANMRLSQSVEPPSPLSSSITNITGVGTNPLRGDSVGSSLESLEEVVMKEQCFDFIEYAALLKPDECFKSLVCPEGNIFHIAVYQNNVEFMDKAMKILPHSVTQSLLTQPLFSQSSEEYSEENPLHIAARKGYHKMVKIILDFYRSSASSSDAQSTNETTGEKPWLEQDSCKRTPLHSALDMCNERIALEILSMDLELLSSMENILHDGPLFLALVNGLYRVALQILISAPNCSLRGSLGRTALFLAAHAPDQIFKLLLEKAPQLIVGQETDGYTVLHYWVASGKLYPVEFVVDSHDIAPDLRRDFIDQLSRTTSESGRNPLHGIIGSFHDDALSAKIVEVMVNAYKRERAQLFSCPEFQPPWLMKDKHGDTPLHHAIKFQHEQLALYLLSLEQIKFSENNDNLLFYSIENQCHKVAEEILGMVQQDATLMKLLTLDDNGQNALHYAPKCTEAFLSQLLETRAEFITKCDDKGLSILHSWIEIGQLWPFEYMMQRDGINPQCKSSFMCLLLQKDMMRRTPLHLAASSSSEVMVDIVKLLLNGSYYRPVFAKLWSKKDSNNNTPLGIAISERHEQLALLFLSMDETLEDVEANLTHQAIEHECHEVVRFLLEWTAKCGDMKFLKFEGCNVLHHVWKSTEENGKFIVERWPVLINECDTEGQAPLERASKVGASWLVELILQKDRSCILKTPLAWVEACERGHLSTILAFADKSSYFKDLCRLHSDTPLHHMQGVDYKDYKALIDHELIKEMKNTQNLEGETPLHVAIKRKNIDLAEILLKIDEVDRNIKDNRQKTAMDLLETTCNQDEKWKQMCSIIGVDPTLRTTYIKLEANLTHMRDIISLVGALLATITFTAGFTLPGGLDDSGQAILATKAAFLVFLMSDGYAMCCSMLVLFCIIWSMVCKHDKSSLLIDRSLVLLKQSLYGTLIAFMTGVYTVVPRKSLWVAIVIYVMCSVVIIASNRSILNVMLPKLIPAAEKGYLEWLCCWKTI